MEDPGGLQSMGSQSQTWLGNWTTTIIDLSIWCHIGFGHTAVIQLCIYVYSEYLRIEVFERYFSNSLGMLGKWMPVRNTSVHSIADCLQLGAVNYKLALTKSIANNWTTEQRHLPSASMETEPLAAIVVNLQQPLREFRVEWGTLCSRESGGTGL